MDLPKTVAEMRTRIRDFADRKYSGEFEIIEKEAMGFSLLLNESDVKIKLKLSQNKSAEDFNLIIESLKRNGENTLAEWMLGNFAGNQTLRKES